MLFLASAHSSLCRHLRGARMRVQRAVVQTVFRHICCPCLNPDVTAF